MRSPIPGEIMSTAAKKDASKPEGAGDNIVEKHVGKPEGSDNNEQAALNIPVFAKGQAPAPSGINREDLEKMLEEHSERMMKASLHAAMEISEKVAKSTIESAMPKVERRSAEIAQAMLERKAKVSMVKGHGVNILTAVGVFAVGSLAKMGYDRYSSKGNDNTRNTNQ